MFLCSIVNNIIGLSLLVTWRAQVGLLTLPTGSATHINSVKLFMLGIWTWISDPSLLLFVLIKRKKKTLHADTFCCIYTINGCTINSLKIFQHGKLKRKNEKCWIVYVFKSNYLLRRKIYFQNCIMDIEK